MTAHPPDPSNQDPPAPPGFSGRINVSQLGNQSVEKGEWLRLGCGSVCGMPFLVAAGYAAWHMEDETGWRATLLGAGALVLIALAICAAMLGFTLYSRFEAKSDNRPGAPKRFHGATGVNLDADGFFIEALGLVAWRDVLALEGIPDSDSYFIVYTEPYGKLLLTASVDDVIPVFHHYMAAADEQPGIVAQEDGAKLFAFKALVFSWPRFMAWIVAGYFFAALTVVGMICAGSPDGMKVLALPIVAAMVAWLVWSFPFSRIDLFGAQRVAAFVIDDADQLASIDGRWKIDLRHASIRRRRSSGIGFTIEFISIRPRTGRWLDLILDGGPLSALSEELMKRASLELQFDPELVSDMKRAL